MKKHLLKLSVLIMAFTFVLSSCDKDEEEDPSNPSSQSTSSNIIDVEGSDATLIAIKSMSFTETPIGNIPIEIGTAVAVFYEEGTENMIDVGTVNLNDNGLSKQSNNSYVFVPGLTAPTGLDFSSGTNWEVAGNAVFSGFSYSPNSNFPDAGEVSSAATVDKSTGYNLTISSISGADSVLYQIGGVHKMLPGNATNCEFTSDDLSSLGEGTNVAQAAALTFLNTDMNGKNVYFIKEMVVTKTVTIQ